MVFIPKLMGKLVVYQCRILLKSSCFSSYGPTIRVFEVHRKTGDELDSKSPMELRGEIRARKKRCRPQTLPQDITVDKFGTNGN